ncbi:cupin domain-containing protein [Candidatus Latescibacterota bacterium]
MYRYCVCIVLWFCSVLIITSAASQAERNNETAPHGFGFNNPENYREYFHLHGGAGAIRYVEEFGPDDFKTKHEFLRVGVIPAKASIGEYRLTDADELFVIMNGLVYVTVNGRTARIVGGSMVPVRINDTIGIYNPTDEDIQFAWLATALKKGEYNPVYLKNDLTKKRFEEPCPFTWMPVDYGNFRITIRSAHEGKGPIYDTFGRIGPNYFTTNFGAYYLVLPPGTSIGYHRHETKEELYFVVSGRARGTVDDVTLDLKPGDCTVVNIDGKHGIYNNGTEDLGLIVTQLLVYPRLQGTSSVNLGDDLSNR